MTVKDPHGSNGCKAEATDVKNCEGSKMNKANVVYIYIYIYIYIHTHTHTHTHTHKGILFSHKKRMK